ncbi:hypothetical protein QVD17_17226 [Tagetes erecta]|uniref:Uncharacterized protein n=1 Tax=Tagetes erecta TaxID=13708 RepID=A0AAD8KVK0_TARER|nr:hypothetical protein QVD17_17226 [Tagetes erecta]
MTLETKKLAIITLFVLLFLHFQPNRACRLLDGEYEQIWMKRGNLLLPSLQHRSVPTPGNGCGNTGNGGNPCIGSRKVAGRHDSGALPPPLTPTLIDHL